MRGKVPLVPGSDAVRAASRGRGESATTVETDRRSTAWWTLIRWDRGDSFEAGREATASSGATFNRKAASGLWSS